MPRVKPLIGAQATGGEAHHAWASPWPALPGREWADTIATVHRWTQIVGKVRMALAPPMSHWWHVPLYVTPRGLTTSAMPYRGGLVEAEFDFLRHVLRWSDSRGQEVLISLPGLSVADVYRDVMATLRQLDVDVEIRTMPTEIADAVPFPDDTAHATYDEHHVRLLHQGLMDAHRVLTRFRATYLGKASPVHFWWGSFDLAVTRFSGRHAPRPKTSAPNCAAWVMDEAYSHEVSSAGWWPNPEGPSGASFYSYAYPEPPGFAQARIRPTGAVYDREIGEFLLSNTAVRRAPDPDAAVLAFLDSTYEAAADLGGWDRRIVEPPTYPVGRPTDAWSVARDS